jgi:hypothetical protein
VTRLARHRPGSGRVAGDRGHLTGGIVHVGDDVAHVGEGKGVMDDLGAAWLADEHPFSEDELTEMALAADSADPFDDDAVPLAVFLGQRAGLLPQWYMPTPMARSGSRWRTPVVLIIVGAFIVIEAMGLCSTFGQLVPG